MGIMTLCDLTKTTTKISTQSSLLLPFTNANYSTPTRHRNKIQPLQSEQMKTTTEKAPARPGLPAADHRLAENLSTGQSRGPSSSWAGLRAELRLQGAHSAPAGARGTSDLAP